VGSAARRDALPELKDLLGHATLAMVMRYAHLAPEHLRNPKTARSPLIGAMSFGVSHAVLEAGAVDPRAGAFVNRDLAEYLVAVHADIPELFCCDPAKSILILRKSIEVDTTLLATRVDREREVPND
jgi:hypothetical protein